MPSAVLYLRMSSDRQETSIPDQRAALLPFAAEKGFDVVGEFADSGISGDATEKRSEFRRMIDAGSRREFDAILCWDLDRFGRFDSLEAGYWIKPLRDAGVRLVTISQGEVDWESFAGRVVNVLQTEAKHAFLRDIARNSLRGRMKAASEGRWVTRVPLGYRLGDDGHLVLGPDDEVETIRRVFSLRLEGLGYRTIAARLNEDGAPTYSGKPWGADTVRETLARETYRGTVVFGKDKRGKYAVAVNGTVGEKGERGQPIRVEGAHPAIIDDALWNAVRVVIPRGHVTSGRPSNAVLAGILVCGCCDGKMYSMGGKRNPIYRCGTNGRGRGCHHCAVPRAIVEAKVAETIREKVIGEKFEDLLAAIRETLSGEPSEKDARASLRRRVRALEGKLAKATERMLDVPDAALATARMRVAELDAELAEARAALDTVRVRPSFDPEAVAAELWRLPDLLFEADARRANAQLRRVMRAVVLDFEPAGEDGRGTRMAWAGGEIALQDCAEVWAFTTRRPSFGGKVRFAA